jgi:hypothetical protein
MRALLCPHPFFQAQPPVIGGMEKSSCRAKAGGTGHLAITREIVAEYLPPLIGRCACLTFLSELFRSQCHGAGRRKFGKGIIHGLGCTKGVDLVVEAGGIDLLEFHLLLAMKENVAYAAGKLSILTLVRIWVVISSR